MNDNKQFEENITEMMEAFIPSEELVEMQQKVGQLYIQIFINYIV